MISIPWANPLAEYQELKAEIDAAVARTLSSGHYILGPEVAAFEQEFAQYVGTEHAVGVASGTDALHLSLRALGVGAGDQVITVSHTAVATVAAIEACGASAVFVDVDPAYYTLDAGRLERALTKRTKAIVPVHIYGQAADLGSILDVATRHGLPVLEDCAQAHGAIYKGQKVGSLGQIAGFSFYPTKNVGALGDGGMIVTGDAELAARVRLLREYGWRERYSSTIPGFNSRLDELQAAILRVKLRHLDDNNARRRRLAELYNAGLQDLVSVPAERPGCTHVYHLYVVRHPRRDALAAYLSEQGIATGIHYPWPVHQQPAYKQRLAAEPDLPVTERLAGEILSLPLYPQLAAAEAAGVVEQIRRFTHARPAG